MKSMDYKQKEGFNVQTLDMPLLESKEAIFVSYLELRLVLAQIIKDNTYNSTDPRIEMVVDLLISGIPNKKFQEQLRSKRNERILVETKEISTNEERGRKIQQINIEIAGEIAPYMDMYTGGERANRISFIIPIKEMKEVIKQANPECFREHLKEDKNNENT